MALIGFRDTIPAMTSDFHFDTWYVRSAKGGVLGPFPAAKVLELLNQGVITAAAAASRTPDFVSSTPVKDIPGLFSPPGTSTEKPFSPPPRPTDLHQTDNASFDVELPTLTLFNTLQASRDRRPRPSESLFTPEITRTKKPLISPKWLAVAAAVIATGVAVWAIFPLNKGDKGIDEISPPAKEEVSRAISHPTHKPPSYDNAASVPKPAVQMNENPMAHREKKLPDHSPSQANEADSKRSREEPDEIPREYENRGEFDDVADNSEETGEQLDQTETTPAVLNEQGEELHQPPQVTTPGENPAADPSIPEGSNYPPPAFD